MKGTVRAWCPKCKKQWDAGSGDKPKIAPYCLKCGIPLKYYVDIYVKGRIKIYYSQRGDALDSYPLAYQALHAVRYEVTSDRFDRTRYVRQEQRLFQFQEAWATYYQSESERSDLAGGTLEGKRGSARYLLDWFGARDVRDINGHDLVQLKTDLLKRLSPKTVRNMLGDLSHFLRWCRANGLIRETLPPIPTVKVPRKRVKWIDEQTQEKIVQEIPDEHRGVFLFCLDHGVRPGEARALQWKDIEFDVPITIDGEQVQVDIITIRRSFGRKGMKGTKTGNERQLVLHPRCKKWMLANRRLNPDDLVFVKLDGKPYSKKWLTEHWRMACKAAGVEGVTMYVGTRHSFASQYVMKGGSLKDLQAVLGHSSLNMTLRYSHENLGAAVRTIHSRGTVHRLSTEKWKAKKNAEKQ